MQNHPSGTPSSPKRKKSEIHVSPTTSSFRVFVSKACLHSLGALGYQKSIMVKLPRGNPESMEITGTPTGNRSIYRDFAG